MECYPDSGASEEACILRGCCWRMPKEALGTYPAFKIGTPRCYFPRGFPTYEFSDVRETAYGYSAQLSFTGQARRFYREKLIEKLQLDVYHYPESNIARIKISDPKEKRYEVPLDYPVEVREEAKLSVERLPTKISTTGITLTDSEERVLFDSTIFAPLIFADQFIQISTSVSGAYAYGFGEVQDRFAKPTNTWRQYSLFASDYSPNKVCRCFRTTCQSFL